MLRIVSLHSKDTYLRQMNSWYLKLQIHHFAFVLFLSFFFSFPFLWSICLLAIKRLSYWATNYLLHCSINTTWGSQLHRQHSCVFLCVWCGVSVCVCVRVHTCVRVLILSSPWPVPWPVPCRALSRSPPCRAPVPVVPPGQVLHSEGPPPPEGRPEPAGLWADSWPPCERSSDRNGTFWAAAAAGILWRGGPALHSCSI